MLVGIVGFIGSGKDTIADMLVKRGFIKEAFARGVKDAVATIFSWDRAMLEGSTAESRAWREQPDIFWSSKLGKDFTPREALQLMGTEAGRNVFYQNLWVDALQRRCNPTKNYAITDCRFANELKMIHDSEDGLIIRVKRGPDPDWYDHACWANADENHMLGENTPLLKVHPSEWKWCGSHYINITIENNGTLADLEEKVGLAIDSYS